MKMVEKPYRWNKSQLKWLEALESGQYKKGVGRLCNIVRKFNKKLEATKIGYEHCCLGVLCDLVCPKKHVSENGDFRLFNGHEIDLPKDIVDKIRMYNSDGKLNLDFLTDSEIKRIRECNSLAKLNDDGGWTFKRIAALIRKNPRAVFRS